MDISSAATSATDCRGNTKSLQSRKWVFTLNNWNEEEYNNIKNFCCDKLYYIIGQEVGDNGTPHLQGYIRSKGGIRFETIKKLIPRAHIEHAKGSDEENFMYCSKQNKFITNDKKHRLLGLYNNIVWKPWQKNILDIIEEEPDNRKMYFIVDKKGNNGKSFLCKYIALTKKCIIADGKKNDIFNQIKTFDEMDEVPKIVLLDVPRDSENYVSYGAIEQIKNGLIYSGKYEGGQVIFDVPHVFIFSNEHLNYKKFSKDRIVKIVLDDEEENEEDELSI